MTRRLRLAALSGALLLAMLTAACGGGPPPAGGSGAARGVPASGAGATAGAASGDGGTAAGPAGGAASGGASAAAGAPSAALVEKPLEIGVVAVSPMGGNDLIVLADRLGFYRKHGLRATLTQASTTTIIQGLIAGGLDVASTSAEAFINANTAGADFVIVGQINRTLQFRMMVPPTIAEPAQLRGTTGCVVSIGGGTYTLMRHYLLGIGINPDSDVSLVATGSSANNDAALRSNRCQFSVASNDTVPRLEAEGFRVLHDFRGTPYPLAVVATTRAQIQSDRERILRFLTALTDTIVYVQTHPTEVMADLVARGVPDDDDLRRAYQEGSANFALPPALNPEAYRNLVEWNAEYLPAFRDLAIERHIDPSLFAELEQNGTLRALGATR